MVQSSASFAGTVGRRAMRTKPKTKAGKAAKIERAMHEYKTGALRSGSKAGPKVKSRKQAVAIALSEAGKRKKK